MAGGELNDALSAIGNLGKALKSTTTQYKESADELRTMYGDTRGAKNRRADAEKKAEIELTKDNAEALGELYKQTMRLKVEQKKGTGVTERSRRQLRFMAKNLKDLNIKGTGKVFEKHLDKMAGDAELTSAEIKKFGEIISKQVLKQEQKLSGDIKEFQSQNRLQRGLDKLTDKVKSATRTFFSMEVGIANFTAGLARSFDELEMAQRHQIGMYGMMSDGWSSVALSMSLAPEEMQKFVATNKNLILSSVQSYGSLNDAVKQSTDTLTTSNTQGLTLQNEAYKLTGDYGKASVLIGNTMTMLKQSGENLSFEELRTETFGLLKTFKGLSQISGKSSEEIQGMTAKFLETDTVRQKMNAMQSNKERQQFIKDTLVSAERNRKLGYSLEQTFQIAEAMTSLSQVSTKERIKQTAVAAQFAGALGLGKQADTITKLNRKKFRTKEEEDELRGAFDTVAREAAKRSGREGAEGESFNLYYDRMLDQMGKTGELMKLSNSTAVQGNALSEDQIKAAKSRESNLEGIPSIMQGFKNTWDEYAVPFFKDSTTQVLGGIFGMAGDIVMGLLSGFGPVLAGFFAGGGTIATLLGGIKMAAAAALPILGPIGIAIAAIAAGVALWSHFSDTQTKAEKQRSDREQRMNDHLDEIKGLTQEQRDIKVAEFAKSEAAIQTMEENQKGHAALAAAALREMESSEMATAANMNITKKIKAPSDTTYSPDNNKNTDPTTSKIHDSDKNITEPKKQILDDNTESKQSQSTQVKTDNAWKNELNKHGTLIEQIDNLKNTGIENESQFKLKQHGTLIEKIDNLKNLIPENAQGTHTVLGLNNRKTLSEQNVEEITTTNELLRNQLDLLQAMVNTSEEASKTMKKVDKSVNQTARQQIDAAKERDEELNYDSRLGRVRRQFIAS